MAQVMCGKMPDQYRISPFLISQHCFVFDIGGADTVYGPINTMGRKRIAVSVLEDKAGVSINDGFIKSDYLLCFSFRFQSSLDL